MARRSKRSGQMALIIVVTTLCGTLYALLGDSGLMAVMRMRGRATQLQYDIAAREQANRELLEIIQPLADGDPAAIEKMAREKLFMARPGDKVYVLPRESPSIEPAPGQPGSPTSPSTPSRR